MQITSPMRPQLTGEQAAQFQYLEVLKRTGRAGAEIIDPWDPLADPFMSGHMTVAPDYHVEGNVAIGAVDTDRKS